ncbi:hypothetical protein [Anaplasma platys]|uniref:hypothetical protein n=1 Tax=Anaplasma platys TaxID=949 RepID=UPI00145E379F|nr:hypothetical protein [Anaplasma platys]
MHQVSGTAVGTTDGDLKLRKPRSVSKAVKAAEKGKLVSTAKAAPAKGKATTSTTKQAASAIKGRTIKRAATPDKKKDTSAKQKEIRIGRAVPQKKEEVIASELHPARHDTSAAQQFAQAGSDISSGVAARAAAARKSLLDPPEKFSFSFQYVAKLCRKIFGLK